MEKSESAGGVIINSNGEVAIVLAFGKSWQLPKGTVDAGEDHLQTATREIEEETGLSNLTYIKAYEPYTRMSGDGNRFMTIYYFLFKANDDELLPQAEITECKWVPIDQVAQRLTYKEDQEFFKSIQAEILGLV